jgi:thiamine-monophosphate kinase
MMRIWRLPMGTRERPAEGDSTARKPAKGERALIRRLAAELPADITPVAFGNDLATLEPVAGGLLWTTDMLMDGVDFESSRHTWTDIGRKAMAVNLSDCAAAATVPVAAVCAVALNDRLSMDDALELFHGVRQCGAEFDCPITGGDTNSWAQPTVICITVAARPDANRAPVTRGGAKPGDRVYLTGRVGGSLLGRHLRPRPQIRTALTINRRLEPHAMIDISDGLAIDLWHICEASDCGAIIDEQSLKDVVHEDAVRLARKTRKSPSEHALHDGEDFELIVVLSPDASEQACGKLGLIPLGEITREARLVLREAGGRCTPIEIRGWEHFGA